MPQCLADERDVEVVLIGYACPRVAHHIGGEMAGIGKKLLQASQGIVVWAQSAAV